MTNRALTPRLLFLTGGLIIWAARFLFAYIFTALACARGFADITILGVGIVPLVVSLATVVAVMACVPILLGGVGAAWAGGGADPAEDRTPGFIGYVGAAIAALAIMAMVFETLPVALIPICE